MFGLLLRRVFTRGLSSLCELPARCRRLLHDDFPNICHEKRTHRGLQGLIQASVFRLQDCGKGFFLSEQNLCLPCSCKGHADRCEDITGVCIVSVPSVIL